MFKKQWPRLLLLLMSIGMGRVVAQTASFNLTAFPHTVSGWTNVSGDPSTAVRTATAGGITISSVATANWGQYGSQSAFDSLGENINGFFPAGVLFNHWYNYEMVYSAAQPQLELSGLSVNGVYTIKLAGSTTSSLNANPTMYTVVGRVNYGSLGVNNHNNSTDGAIFNGVVPDATGSISLYINTLPSTEVADISGVTIVAAGNAGTLSLGAGLAQVGLTMAIGDSVAGKGPHSFVTNRYQYLGGHQYSFGGSVRDPVNRGVLHMYDIGDLAASTTMNRSVNTDAQTGLRFYSKLGIVQVGSTDRLDTTVSIPNAPESWPGGGIVMNSNNSSNPNILKGRIMDSYISGSNYNIDSTATLAMVILNGQHISIAHAKDTGDMITGNGITLGANMVGDVISGTGHNFANPVSLSQISGSLHTAHDTVYASLLSGASNQIGGSSQFTSGVNLINPTPNGLTLGSGNVDFSSLGYTGVSWINTPGLSGYPLFALGNSSSNGSFRSNAWTILYNGRTQINTAGLTAGLNVSQVTPQAALDVVSTNTGVLLPRLTTTQVNAIAGGDLHSGLLLFNTDSTAFRYYNGSSWKTIASGPALARWAFAGTSVYDSLDNIAIGTSNPKGYKLAVNGTAIFVRMVVKSAGTWPDYVFRRNYRLPGLGDLERYLSIHHHLPGVAGNAEIMQHGIDVAEQQRALLKKAEEVALYLLQENAELKEQTRQLGEKAALLEAHQKKIDELKDLLKAIK